MKRRTMVSALGASFVPLSACFGQTTSAPDSTDTATDTPTPTRGDGSRQVRVTSVGSVPDEAPLATSVEVLRSNVTTDQTARITVEVTNTADQTVWHTATRITAFSDFITQESNDGRKLMLLKPDVDYATVRSGCWRADLAKWEINHAYTNVAAYRKYPPGETKATQFDIYGHPENTDTCLAPGEYPLESLYTVSDDRSDTAEWEYPWGFSLTVEES